jgi:sugar-specific transcriptional regulator TrmB
MKKLLLPERLIASLVEIGLLESEAKIYSALVLLGYAGVGDLIEALDVSKPRIYASLGTLEERGMIVQTSPRPAIYQAVAPNIAMETIMKKYDDAKDEAIEQFKAAEKQEIIDKPSPPLCYVLGNKNFEFKIKDMLDNAKESVICQMSEKYVRYLEKPARNGVEIRLILLTDDASAQKRLELLFKKCNVKVKTLGKDRFFKRPTTTEARGQKYESNMAQLQDMMDYDKQIVLLVDDSEVLLTPGIKGDTGAITSTNKVLVFMMKNGIEERLATNTP